MYLILLLLLLLILFYRYFTNQKENFTNKNNVVDKIIFKNFTDKIKRKCLTEKDERNEPCLVYYIDYYK